jgi:hypothetical protein
MDSQYGRSVLLEKNKNITEDLCWLCEIRVTVLYVSHWQNKIYFSATEKGPWSGNVSRPLVAFCPGGDLSAWIFWWGVKRQWQERESLPV